MSRRKWLAGALLSATGLCAAGERAFAQTDPVDYPTRQIELIAGYAAGGGMDVLARYFAERLGTLAGKPVIVVNKAGANGNLAAQEVAQARPDGYKLLWAATSTYASNQFLYKDLPFDARRDLKIVATATEYGFLLIVPTEGPATVEQLKKSLAGKAKAVYGASGSTTMAAAELFKSLARVKATYVAYKTSQDVMRDVSAGELDFGIVDATAALARARQGQLKPLGVTMKRRMNAAPEIPTLDEVGAKGYELNGWMAISAPAATPSAIVDRLNGWMQTIVGMNETKAFLATAVAEPFGVPRDQIPAFVDAQTEKWRKLIQDAGLTPQ
ncbi:tripartite tricarboxylate transporter substrate binding protein [Roseiarcaceae bacterium H3SJ34-1]|uniref:Bug family tripartite tricarboxylate transporter substrate binding protein n=1 Tax=Terripilifer ovatus TaxID=3032367 RepID=UPI003AB970DF|nr:tripartite tricarboxylate transporter substrate binding protein [Roseiarcaceae bacterium H3SJ34-1]